MNIDADNARRLQIQDVDVQDGDVQDGDPHDEIARLELRIEELAASVERCRKFKLASQIAIASGALWMVATLIGAIRFDGVAMMAALSAVIGGIVVFGSNNATWSQVSAALKDAEARRAALIGRLELRVVGEGRGAGVD